MRVVPILFPSDLGRSDRGRYQEGGERGAPDVILDVLESEGVRMACHDALTEGRVDQGLARAAGVRAMVVAPLRAGRYPIGVLGVTSARRHAFGPADVAAL